MAIDSLEQLSKRQIINGKMMRLLDFYDEAISIYSIDSVEWRNQQYDTIFVQMSYLLSHIISKDCKS